MAAIFIVAGLAIAEKVEKKKEAKRQKKARDEARYRELQVETTRRLSRTQSGTVVDNTFVEHPEEAEEDDTLQNVVDDPSPPPYEDAVRVGERREQQWQAQMQRRRSSVNSNGANAGTASYMRMG